MMKRLFDLIASTILLVLLAPLLMVLVLITLLLQGRPILFTQTRVGRYGKPFQLLKFRTMIVDAESLGSKITVGGDHHITPFGHFLRKTKTDELPQLWNVIRGEMSLVGPRPEVPEYVNLYSLDQRRVLEVRPGITDVASLKYYDESDQLAKVDDPKHHYIDVIMPDKIQLNLEYLETASVWSDLHVVWRTALRVLFPSSKSKSLQDS